MLDAFDTRIKPVLATSKLCIQASIILGVLVTILYCGQIGHYPSGLTLGDSLFFVVASLAFAVNYSLVVLSLLTAGITVSPFLRWAQRPILFLIEYFLRNRNRSKFVWKINFPHLRCDRLLMVLPGLLIIGLLEVACASGMPNSGSLVATTFVISFLWGLWHTKPRRRDYRIEQIKWVKPILAILIYLSPLAVIQFKGNFLNQSMKMIGVRSDSRVVQLDKRHVEFLGAQGIRPASTTQKGEGIYKNALILFRGIGQDVIIKIEEFSFSVPISDVIIGRKAD